MEKPLSLILKDTKLELANICNNSNLPACLLEPILKELYLEVRDLKNRQEKIDEELYNSSLSEEQTFKSVD